MRTCKVNENAKDRKNEKDYRDPQHNLASGPK